MFMCHVLRHIYWNMILLQTNSESWNWIAVRVIFNADDSKLRKLVKDMITKDRKKLHRITVRIVKRALPNEVNTSFLIIPSVTPILVTLLNFNSDVVDVVEFHDWSFWQRAKYGMMMNCFCSMVDRRQALSLIFSRDHCQRSSLSRISDTPRAGFGILEV